MRTTLRNLRPSDMPRLRELLIEQNERDGTSYGLPAIFDSNGVKLASIPLALGAVDKSDQVIQGHVWIQTLEQMTFGTDPRATACSIREMGAVWFALRNLGYHDVHLQVPKIVVGDLERGLARDMRMTRDDHELAHFYRLLDHDANERLRAWRDSQAPAVPSLSGDRSQDL